MLALGSQVRAHIARRYSMPWSKPAARMREFVLAKRATWASWNGEGPLAFEGEFYRHTLMTPVFDQGPSSVGDPRVFIAAVGPAMTAVAGEVADGLVLHGFTTPAYAKEVSLPNLVEGLRRAGRSRADVEVTVPAMVVVVPSEEHLEERRRMMRSQVAFYGSTPAYRGVLDHHGWGALADELHRLSKVGDWEASPEEAGAAIAERFGGVADRVQVGFDPEDPEAAARLRAAIDQRATAPAG